MRILSGKYRNRKLKSLKDETVRPTSSLVKKSLFDILKVFNDKKVLDLFSGTGSLGIESLSRGAKRVIFVEKNRKVIKVLTDNVKTICPLDDFLIINQDVNFFLDNENELYDVIFADPPYGLFSFEELRDKVCKLLKYGGIFCMEQRYDNRDYIDGVRVKKYGNTQILIWQKQRK